MNDLYDNEGRRDPRCTAASKAALIGLAEAIAAVLMGALILWASLALALALS